MTDFAGLSGTFDIVAIDGAPPIGPLTPTIALGADGSISGQLMNRFSGTCTITEGRLTCGPLVTTMMAGPLDVMNQESHVLALLGQPLTIAPGHEGSVLLTGETGHLTLRPAISRPEGPPDVDLAARTLTVSGTIGYRQRISLPSDAEATVTLEDQSRADAAATVLATHTHRGGQVPIPFTLTVTRSRIPQHARIAVRARILSQGVLLWTTDTAYGVDPTGDDVFDLTIMLVQVSSD